MTRDIKTNYNQLTLGQLRRMCDMLLSLGDDQRVVTVPERALKEAPDTAALSNPAAGGDSSGGNSGKKTAPATGTVAMEVGEGSDDDEAGLEESNKKTKKNKSKCSKNKKSGKPA